MFIALVEHLESKFHFFKPKLRSTITNYNQLRQYSASTTYVFAWSEIYVQGIWALLIVAIPVSLALSSRPWVLGWESWQFYLGRAGSSTCCRRCFLSPQAMGSLGKQRELYDLYGTVGVDVDVHLDGKKG